MSVKNRMKREFVGPPFRDRGLILLPLRVPVWDWLLHLFGRSLPLVESVRGVSPLFLPILHRDLLNFRIFLPLFSHLVLKLDLFQLKKRR